jgi:hypothetical protein
MPERMVAIAIAVADATPLEYLAAALNGARDFAAWSSALGYETTIVTDEHEPVTVARLSRVLDAVLTTATENPIDRFVLYFAGHGLIREAEESLWLVSDWSRSARAVRVELLKRRLFSYHVNQIAIFSDSCRLLPSDRQAAELTQDAVIGYGPRRRDADEVPPPIDTFVAAQDYAASFAVPGQTEREDRCIFTGVLMPGLWGTKAQAFSKTQHDRVVSRSLGKYLEEEVKRVAALYRLKLAPSIFPTFPEDRDVYFQQGQHAVTPPPFPEWPPAASLISNRVSNEADKDPLLGPGRPGEPAPKRVRASVTGNEQRAERGKGAALSHQLAALRHSLRGHRERDCLLAVDGAAVRRLWSPATAVVTARNEATRWRIAMENWPPNSALPILVQFENGHVGSFNALPSYRTSLVCDARGVSAAAYDFGGELTSTMESVITRLEKSALRGNDAHRLASELGREKYTNPILGVLVAYLYDAIGDLQGIRRMAFNFAILGQSVPYDIALLARLHGGGADSVTVTVPRKSPRAGSIIDGRTARSTHNEVRSSIVASVSGLWPWMRQGWPLLNSNDVSSSWVHPDLHSLTSCLQPSRFTTMNEEGGRLLADLFDMAPNAAL